LQSGQVLADDLRMKDGRLLITRGTKLNQNALKIINEIGEQSKIENMVAIMMPLETDSGGEAEA
jgi:hypothetical protein